MCLREVIAVFGDTHPRTYEGSPVSKGVLQRLRPKHSQECFGFRV